MSILVAIADDTASGAVLDAAISLGEELGEELYVVHVVGEEIADAKAKRIRDQLRERLADAPVVSTVSLEHVGRLGSRQGPRIGQELLEIAADVDVSQIVMGHQAKGISGRLWNGDAAFAVVNGSTVPVTIIPTEKG